MTSLQKIGISTNTNVSPYQESFLGEIKWLWTTGWWRSGCPPWSAHFSSRMDWQTMFWNGFNLCCTQPRSQSTRLGVWQKCKVTCLWLLPFPTLKEHRFKCDYLP